MHIYYPDTVPLPAQIKFYTNQHTLILRGNSGSGKTTVSKELQKKFGKNTMYISQDMVRRQILMVDDGNDTLALSLMKEMLSYGSRNSEVVILEGIIAYAYNSPYNIISQYRICIL